MCYAIIRFRIPTVSSIRVQSLLDQSRRHEVTLHAEMSKLENKDKGSLLQAQARYDELESDMKQLQEELHQKESETRFFDEKLRKAIKEHQEALSVKDQMVESILHGEEAQEREADQHEMMECVVSSAKMLTLGYLQLRLMLRRAGRSVDVEATGESKGNKVEQVSSCLQSGRNDIHFIKWDELLMDHNDRKEILEFVKLTFTAGMSSITSLVDDLRLEAEAKVAQVRDHFEGELLNLKQVHASDAALMHTLVQKKDFTWKTLQAGLSNLTQRLDGAKRDLVTAQDMYKQKHAIATNMESELVKVKSDLENLQQEHYMVSDGFGSTHIWLHCC